MVNNSNTQRIDSVGTTLTGSEGINQKGPFNSEGYNSFNRSRKVFSSFRFADIKPHFCVRTNSGDVVRYQPSAMLRNVKLPQPLLTRVQAHNTVVQIPKSAICPRSFEYQIVPEGGGYTGDDIPESAYPTVDLASLIEVCTRVSVSGGRLNSLTELVHLLLYLELVCSHDGLLANLGYTYVTDGSKFKDITGASDFDTWVKMCFDALCASSASVIVTINSLDVEGVQVSRRLSDCTVPEVRDIFEKMATGVVTCTFRHSNRGDALKDSAGNVYADIKPLTDLYKAFCDYVIADDLVHKLPTIDACPLYAYQMAVAQLFTNDKIDSVHSAKEWLDNQESLAHVLFDITQQPYPLYTVNERAIVADVTSQMVLSQVLEMLSTGIDDPTGDFGYLQYTFLYNIFAYQKSLKYLADDLFGSCRVRPLANGDVTAHVADGRVSAVDMNKALWMQRFLNAVNRASADVYKYLRDIFGVEPSRKIPMPYLLLTESYKVDSNEVTNTGDDTGSQASILVASGMDKNKYYDLYIDEPSYIIGLLSFTQETPMSAQVHGELLRNYRDELFNPMFQHFGDQAVEIQEYRNSIDQNVDKTFGYQQRYSEYKFPYQTVTGVFRGSLKHWLCQDNIPRTMLDVVHVISSDEIRNQNLCFDQVTTSAINPTLGEYFHFIGVIDNSITVNSKMQKYTTLL